MRHGITVADGIMFAHSAKEFAQLKALNSDNYIDLR